CATTPASSSGQQQHSGKGHSTQQPPAEVRPAEPQLFRPPAGGQQAEGSSTGQQGQPLKAQQAGSPQRQHSRPLQADHEDGERRPPNGRRRLYQRKSHPGNDI